MSLVSVFNEWDPIEEMIVGSSLHAKFPVDDPTFKIVERLDQKTLERIAFYNVELNQLIEETEEDIDNFISKMLQVGISIKRPLIIIPERKIQTTDWETSQYFCYCPRDTMITIGNTIIESPNVYRSRYFENNAYKNILVEYMKSGANWIAAPKPRLLNEGYNSDPNAKSILNELEPVFDAANILRCGKDIFYLVSDSGNELGYQWLKNLLSEQYTVHRCADLYSGIHFDTTMVLLRPGLLLINPERVDINKLPEKLQKWKILKAPAMKTVSYSSVPNVSSAWIGMNLLMLAPNLAVVDQNQTELITLLEQNFIRTIPSLLRHGRVFSGGFHCITLDIRRRGSLENYW